MSEGWRDQEGGDLERKGEHRREIETMTEH